MSPKVKYILKPMLWTLAWMGSEIAVIMALKSYTHPTSLLVLLIVMAVGMALNVGSYAASNFRHIQKQSKEWAWHLFWYEFITRLHAEAEERGQRLAPLPPDEHTCQSFDETHVCVWPGCWEKVK